VNVQLTGLEGARRQAYGLAALLLFLTILGVTVPVAAQDADNQAGLVIQFGDGSLYTACVDLGTDGQATGEDLLRSASLDPVIDYNSGFGGGTVCKIGDDGCSFPADKCFCQCTMKPGEPCVYWTYFHLLDGQWRYANLGASSFIVKPGSVQAWVWGLGGVGSGVQPPNVTFEQICGDSSEATLTPSVADSLIPTERPLPTRTTLSTLLPTTPEASPQPTPVTVKTLAPSTMPESKLTALPQQTATAVRIAAGVAGEQLAPVDHEPPTPTPLIQEGEDGPNTANYVVFGVLVAILAGGLIFLGIRQGR
jgi:hypothetical protein